MPISRIDDAAEFVFRVKSIAGLFEKPLSDRSLFQCSWLQGMLPKLISLLPLAVTPITYSSLIHKPAPQLLVNEAEMGIVRFMHCVVDVSRDCDLVCMLSRPVVAEIVCIMYVTMVNTREILSEFGRILDNCSVNREL